MSVNDEGRRLRQGERMQIEAALHRYARGVDRKDWELFRSAYHSDAVDDHGDFRGDIDSLVGVGAGYV